VAFELRQRCWIRALCQWRSGDKRVL